MMRITIKLVEAVISIYLQRLHACMHVYAAELTFICVYNPAVLN